jgi:hypothetical protein
MDRKKLFFNLHQNIHLNYLYFKSTKSDNQRFPVLERRKNGDVRTPFRGRNQESSGGPRLNRGPSPDRCPGLSGGSLTRGLELHPQNGRSRPNERPIARLSTPSRGSDCEPFTLENDLLNAI